MRFWPRRRAEFLNHNAMIYARSLFRLWIYGCGRCAEHFGELLISLEPISLHRLSFPFFQKRFPLPPEAIPRGVVSSNLRFAALRWR